MVCEHRKGQPAECVENTVWSQHIPGLDSKSQHAFLFVLQISWDCCYFHNLSNQTVVWSVLVFNIFSFFFFLVSSLKSRPRCWAVIYPWTTSTLSPDQVTRRQPYTRSSIKNAETKKGHLSFPTRPVRSWRLSRLAQKKKKRENCRKSDLGSSVVLRASAEMRKGDSISARWTGADGARWTERRRSGFVSLLLVNTNNWDGMRGQA